MIGNGRHHVVKIVCGVGYHTEGTPVLINVVPNYLNQNNYDIHKNEAHGVVLVKLVKEWEYKFDAF
jgi:hypothetical protein